MINPERIASYVAIALQFSKKELKKTWVVSGSGGLCNSQFLNLKRGCDRDATSFAVE
jgi:hypothetical protein